MIVRGRALKGADLGAHPGARGVEEGDERIVAGLAPRAAVCLEQDRDESLAPQALKVHRQKGEIRRDIGVAQSRVELEPIEDADAVLDDDVLGAQIAVAVAHPSLASPPCHPLRASIQEGVGEAAARGEAATLARIGAGAHKGGQAVGNRLALVLRGGHGIRGGRRRGVKAREAHGYPTDVIFTDVAGLEQRAKGSTLVQPPHLHRVLDRPLVIGVDELNAAPRARHDRPHAEIEARRERLVDPHLFVGEHAAALEAAVVQELEDDRPSHLVGTIVGQEHPRAMRLAHLDALRRRRVHARIGHRPGEVAHAPDLRSRSRENPRPASVTIRAGFGRPADGGAELGA